MASLISKYPPCDPALDLGCGSGDLAICLALLGHEVLGVDFVETAIDEANRKRDGLPSGVASLLTFRVADAARPSALGKFRSVFDSGFLHLLDDDESDVFVDELALALVGGGRYYLHEFAVEFPIENVPRAVTEVELRERFTSVGAVAGRHGAIPCLGVPLDEEDREGQDEATVRLVEPGALDIVESSYFIRTDFTLANGSRFLGLCNSVRAAA
jgi:SAM-dependent methyltransferase